MAGKGLPLFICGKVSKGFGRGSKELGIPTANMSEDVVNANSDKLETGVYFGWARVNDGEVYKMVMSVGWNPFYKNEKKSMEAHILHQFSEDFYGANLRLCIAGYIRPEMNFSGVDELIKTIKNDISTAEKELGLPKYLQYQTSPYLTKPLASL